MKKHIFVCTIILIVGLLIGFTTGFYIAKNKAEVQTHNEVVRALHKMSDELLSATASFYANNAYSVSGQHYPDAVTKVESTVWFVSQFLENYTDYRNRNGLRFSVETEKMLKDGRAIPEPSNKEYYHMEILSKAKYK